MRQWYNIAKEKGIWTMDYIRFLTFAYMGIDVFDTVDAEGEILKSLIKKCALKAYQDLKRRVPYTYNSIEANKPGNEKYRNKKEQFKAKVIEIITEAITKDGSLIPENQIIPCKIIETVLAESKKSCYKTLFKDDFTVGLAQKWVNMTLKNLMAIQIIKDGDTLDAPIDSYIIKAAKMERQARRTLGLGAKKYPKCAWSKWNNLEEYIAFQNEIKDIARDEFGMTAIAWENQAWVEIANQG